MTITLLISHYQALRRVAYLQDERVIHIDLEWPPSKTPSFAFLDQIYWGRVVQVGHRHAFVKVADHQVGLLPFERPFSKPHEGKTVLVQVRREAIPDKGTHHKGPILTRKITLGGRYGLYHPFQKERLLSSKIQDPLVRKRLQALLPTQEPVTFREAAAQTTSDQILADIDALKKKFLEIEALSPQAPCLTPYGALPPSHRWMRDLEAGEGDAILVDDDRALIEVRNFLKTCRPDLLAYVKKHPHPLFEAYGLEDFWDSLFQDVIELPGGGNIVMEVTAAATVIDVNPGNKSAQETSLETNLEAIPLIVQHLKGRHLGGNIIIDFMGLEASPPDRKRLTHLLQKQASESLLPLHIFGWSKLGWLEARLPKRRMPLNQQFSLFEGGENEERGVFGGP